MSKRKILIGIFVVIFAALFSLGIFLKGEYVAPILMYHSVSPGASPENRLSISVKTFQRQMHFLKNKGYNVLPLKDLADLIKNKKRVPAKTVAITFDDGYKDNYIYAFPVLKKYNLPATMFIIVKEVGRPQNDRLTWDEIGIMQDSGLITFGSHALGPDPLTKIVSDEDLRKEVWESKRILEEKLGKPVNMFSYAEGRFNDKIRQLVRDAGYKLAVATSPGKKFANNDIFVLKRLRISSTSDNLFVFWVEISGLYTFIKERRDD